MSNENQFNPLAICESQIIENDEYLDCVQDILQNETFLQMQQYIHHGTTTCLKHCVHVSYCSYLLAKRFHLDYRSVARAGLIHDLFLYDWHTRAKESKDHFHGFRHPRIALSNARQIFTLNTQEQDIILRHMWPLTPAFPKYKESYLVSMMDKYCGTMEVFRKPHLMVPVLTKLFQPNWALL